MKAKAIVFYVLMIGFALLVIEAAAFATGFITPDLFDHRASTLARIDAGQWHRDATADPELGWEPRAPRRFVEDNCAGSSITYTIAEDHSRAYANYRTHAARIVLAGDSYTYGSEVGDEATYPARLASILNEPVANLGVGGYDPVQSLLRLQRRVNGFPDVTTVVLGVMYENVHRMMNRYRPVLYEGADARAFKPFMAGGQISSHPGFFDDHTTLRAAAIRAFDSDFWAKPRHRFPYTGSLWAGLDSHYFTLRKVQKRLRSLGQPEYSLSYATPEIRDNLEALLQNFAAFGADRGLTPVVLFMPRNPFDLTSASAFLDARRSHLPDNLVVGDVGATRIDWPRYNLRNADNICHPSPYGYRKIAAAAARLISLTSAEAIH